ncbi:MAG: glycoside hydrolase [Bacteroidaceae bacterium]|nr:glycoside hydrolase [Bacteroidaceae bacterium]
MQTQKLKALFAAIALLMGFTATVWAQTTTVTVDKSHGNLYRGGSINNTEYASEWKSSDNMLKFSCGANNMKWSSSNLEAHCGTSGSATYTLAPVEADDYVITGYSLKLHSQGSKSQVWVINGTTYTSSSTGDVQTINVTGLNERSVAFTESQNNDTGTLLYEFTVTLKYSPRTDGKTVFTTPSSGTPYRIPAVAQAKNGDLVFVSDYRYSYADIGMQPNGKLDLKVRKKKANGTWESEKTLQKCIETPTFTAFGDPCIVCDNTPGNPGRIMVTSCCGNVSFPGGKHSNHQGWARWYSDNDGDTWSSYTDISKQVMDQVDERTGAKLKAFFIGSGKISQSKTIKVGNYNRLYCASLTRVNADGESDDYQTMNFVWYSDDFGENWHMLGDADHNPITGGDEPKADELPDGSVLISSRTTGRIYNIWHYTNEKTGEGYWGRQVTSGNGNGGTYGANCNGEILVMPVKRTADGKKTYVLLQSIPYGTDRSLVSIYWKELTDLSKYRTAAELAPNDWTRYQISNVTSAYSTMCQMANGHIAFFYEENSHNSGYDMVFKELDINTITNGAYTYSELDTDEKNAYLTAGVDPYFSTQDYGDEELAATINGLANTYKEAPSRENYEKLNAALAEVPAISGIACPYVSPDPVDGNWAEGTKKYTFNIKGKYITTSSMTDGAFDTNNSVVPTSAEGYWVITGSLAKGYQFRNVREGATKVLGITGSEDVARAKLYDENSIPDNVTTRFHYDTNSTNANGSTFYLYGSDTNSLNVRAPYLALWNNGASFSNDGSCIVLTLVEELPEGDFKVKYNLTDAAGHNYTGQFTGQLSQAPFTGVDGMTLSNVSYTESSETDVDYNLTATVSFPFTVSNGTDGKYVHISGFNGNNFYWYADGTDVKATKAATPNENDYKKYSWAIIPAFNGTGVTLTVKNVLTGKYINSTTTSSSHNPGAMTLADTGSPLYYNNTSGNKWLKVVGTGLYLSLNSSTGADGSTQNVGVHSNNHNGTKLSITNVTFTDEPVVEEDPAANVSATFTNTGSAWANVQIAVNATSTKGESLNNVTATVNGSTALKTVSARPGHDVIVINKNTNAMSNEPMTFTISGLAAGSTFSKISLPFYAVNGNGGYQPVNLGTRHINVSVTVKEGDATLYEGSVTDFNIGAKCGPDVLNDQLVFTPNSTVTKTTNNPLTVEFKISKGTDNAGCFVAFQSLNLTTEQTVKPVEELQAKIMDAFEHIYNGEVGYPDGEAEANADALNALFEYVASEEITAENYDEAKAAYDAVLGLTTVNMPVPGKAYTIAFRKTDGTKKWYVKGNTVTENLAEATVFIAGNSSKADYPYIFVDNSHNYLQFHGATATAYAENTCDFSCTAMAGISTSSVTATPEQKFGTVCMVAYRRSSGYTDRFGCLILKESNHNWDNADNAFMNGTFTSALEIEEATYGYNHPTLVKPSEEDSEAFATVYLPFAMQMPEGVEAYAAIEKQEKEGQVSLKLELANADNQPVAAGAYILYSQSEEEVKTPKTVIPAAATPAAIEDNKLIGSTANTDATELCSAELTGHNPYVLGLSGGQAVFCPYVGTVYPKGKAIWLAETNQVSAFSLDFDQIVEAIHTLKAAAADQPIYDLQGRRLQSVQKGISISAGHKVLR